MAERLLYILILLVPLVAVMGLVFLLRTLWRLSPLRGKVAPVLHRTAGGAARRLSHLLPRNTFSLFFWACLATVVTWLLLGLAPAIAHAFPSLHSALHSWGHGTGVVAELSRNIAQASHNSYSSGEVLLDYVFSALNVSLAVFLVLFRPNDRTARLLALGMLGTAVAFNLQGHAARQVVATSWLPPVDVWHNAVHVVSGVAYMCALFLFPDGKFVVQRSAPYVLVLVLGVALLSLGTTQDHTVGLVLVFGILTPLAGFASQVRRYRRSTTAESKQQSRLLVWTLAGALGAAVVLMAGGIALTSSDTALAQTTRDYEFRSPKPGVYAFFCDPHANEMKGQVRVVPASRSGTEPIVPISAENYDFSKDVLTLPANQEVKIRFTNKDADQHNVSIYDSYSRAHPIFVGAVFSGQGLTELAFRVFQPVFVVIPLALFVGLIKFRLWEIDKVISRTVLYAALAAFIGLVYVAVVVGLGAAIGAGSGSNLALSIAATALIAVAFEPVRERLERVANRLVYGERASPYEVLSSFSDRVSGSFSSEDILPRMARVLAEGTDAQRADVWLAVGSTLTPEASWPSTDDSGRKPLGLNDGQLPVIPGVDRAVAVRHQGELLGALTIVKESAEQLTPVEEGLLNDLASQAGLVLRNVGLTAELQARLDEISARAVEIRESRQRIVAAQDSERRRLERDVHDGAQQHLVALAVKLRLARTMVARDPVRAKEIVNQLEAEVTTALHTLKELSRGIFPPVLARLGLGSALRAQAGRTGLMVDVDAPQLRRYPPEAEAAVYFACLEALQNVAKYSKASRVVITLREHEGDIQFSVEDDGVGFDVASTQSGTGLQNMSDRIDAVGGTLRVESVPGVGTTVSGTVPVPAEGSDDVSREAMVAL